VNQQIDIETFDIRRVFSYIAESDSGAKSTVKKSGHYIW